MLLLSKLFHPMTARPFLRNETYVEMEPCPALKPYISCFWGAPGFSPDSGAARTAARQSLVIPDTCMDIILEYDPANGPSTSLFVGINDSSFLADINDGQDVSPCFAIRFYAWAVPLFADDSMKQVLNGRFDVDAYFKGLRKELLEQLADCATLCEKKEKAELCLVRRLEPGRQDCNVLNAVYKLLETKGTAPASELTRYTAVGQRQLERLFIDCVGVSPKKLAGLIRYQYLWQEIALNGSSSIQDAVFEFAYTDQAHLLNDFRKYHSMTPAQARAYALTGCV